MLGAALSLFVAFIAALSDARSGRIPNWLTLGGVSGGCALGAAAGGLAGLGSTLLGVAVAASPWFVGYLLGRGNVGGGDVKLFAAFGALLGPERALEVAFGALLLALAAWLGWAALHPTTPGEVGGARAVELRLGPPALAALVILMFLRLP